MFIAFNAYIWTTAKRFGSKPEYNTETVYVVFGISILATSAVFRWIIVGTLSLMVGQTMDGVAIMICCFAYFRLESRRQSNGWEMYGYDDRLPATTKDTKVHQ